MPQRIPSLDDPHPPVHTLETLKLPVLILDLFDVSDDQFDKHIWEVDVELLKLKSGKLQRIVKVRHQGEIVDQSKSRSWE